MDRKQYEDVMKLKGFFQGENGPEVLYQLAQITGYFENSMGNTDQETYTLIGRRSVMVDLIEMLQINTAELLVMIEEIEQAEKINLSDED